MDIKYNTNTAADYLSPFVCLWLMDVECDMSKDARYFWKKTNLSAEDFDENNVFIGDYVLVTECPFKTLDDMINNGYYPTYTLSDILFKLNEYVGKEIEFKDHRGKDVSVKCEALNFHKDAPFYMFSYSKESDYAMSMDDNPLFSAVRMLYFSYKHKLGAIYAGKDIIEDRMRCMTKKHLTFKE